MNSTTPHGMREVERQLFTKAEFCFLLRQAAAMRQRRKSDRLRAYESLKRQLQRIVGWGATDAAVATDRHFESAVRLLCKTLGV